MTRPKKDKSLLTGKHKADRLNEIIPEYENLDSNCPDWLTDYAKRVYEEFYSLLVRGGTLKQTDHYAFLNFCLVAGNVRYCSEKLKKEGMFLVNPKTMKSYTNPACAELRYQSKALNEIARELGMTPRARANVTVSVDDKMKADDKLSKLMSLANAS